MDTETINAILSSTLLISLISTLFLFYKNKKSIFTKNITTERQKWRDELRRIAKEISNCNSSYALQKQIDNLTVMVNPLGRVPPELHEEIFIDEDSFIRENPFIWDFVKKFNDERKKNRTQLEKSKSELIGLISCILKYDWDRSKKEIAGDSPTIVLIVAVAASALLTLSYYLSHTDESSHYIQYCTTIICVTFICAIFIRCSNVWKCIIILLITFLFFVPPCVTEVSPSNRIIAIQIFSPFIGFFIYCGIKEWERCSYNKKMKKTISNISP